MAATVAELSVPIRGDNAHLKRVMAESRNLIRDFASQSSGLFNSSFSGGSKSLTGLTTQMRSAMTQVQQSVATSTGQINQHFQNMHGQSGSAMQGMGVSAVAMGSLIAGAVQSVLSSIGNMVSSVVAGGFAFNSMKEQATVAFTNLLGSTDLAKEHLAELFDLANRTPFESEGIIRASQRLQAMGFEAKQVIPTLTTVADAVAGVGGGADVLQGVITALGQIQSKGKASAEEMNQLAERGIPAWKFLADSIGKSIPEAMKLAEKGAISADVAITGILKGMQEKFGGLAAAQSKTWAGLLSTISDVSKQVFGELTGPLFEKARDSLGKIVDFLPKLIPLAQEIGLEFNRWIEIFEPAAKEVINFFTSLSKSLNDSGRGFENFRDGAEMVARVMASGVGNGLRVMSEGLQVVDKWLGKVGASVHDLMGFINPFIGALNLLGKTGDAFGFGPDRAGEDAWKEYRKTMRETDAQLTDMKRNLRDAFDPEKSVNKLTAAVKKVKQTISEMSPFITERAIAGSPEAVKGVVDRFVDTLVNELNNNKDRVGEVGGSLASMFINRFEASLGTDKKSSFFDAIIEDLRALAPAIDSQLNKTLGDLRNLVEEVGVSLGEAGLQSEQTLRSVIDNLRKQVGITDAIWKSLDKTQRSVLDEGFRAAAQIYINQLRLLSLKTQDSALDQSIAIQKLFTEWRTGVLSTEQFMARLSDRTEDLTVSVVSHVDAVAVATKSLADQTDKALKKVSDSIENNLLIQTDRLAIETRDSIESVISMYERYGEQLGLTGDALEQFVEQKVRAAMTDIRGVTKEGVEKVIQEWKRLQVTLPGIWDEVFRKASASTRKGVNDILVIVDLIPGRVGDALRKAGSEFERWYTIIDKTIRLIERALGETETEGLSGVFNNLATTIGSFFKKAQAETKSQSETWADQVAKAMGGLGGESEEAGEDSGKSFSEGFLGKLGLIASGVATFFGSRGQGKVAGVIGGAAAGAQIGTAILPGWGTAIGAAAGAIAGLFGAGGPSDEEKRRAEEDRRLQIEQLKQSLAKGYEELKQSILTTARDFIKFVDELAGSATIPKDVLNKFINNMTRTLLKLADAMKSIAPHITDSVKKASENLLPAIDLMSRMPLAFDAINKHFSVADSQIDLYFRDLDKIAEKIGASAEASPNKIEKHIKKFASRMSPAVDLMKGVGELIKQMFETKEMPTDASFGIWEAVIGKIVEGVGRLSDKFDKWWIKTMAAFAEKAKSGLSFWKEATDAIRATKDVPSVSQSDVDNIIGGIELFLTSLVKRLSDLAADELNKVASLAPAITSVASAIKNWAETSVVIRDYAVISADVWESIVSDFKKALQLIHLLIADALLFVDEAKTFDELITTGASHLESGFSKFANAINFSASLLNGTLSNLNALTTFSNNLSSSAFSGGGQASAFSTAGNQTFTSISTPAPFVGSPIAAGGFSGQAQTVVNINVTVPVHGNLIHQGQIVNEVQKALVEMLKRGIVKSGGSIQFV